MEPAPTGAPVRQVRHRLMEEAEGCQSVIQRRRSPRCDALDEDRDFEPEVPVRRAKMVPKVTETKAPKPKSPVQGASASKNKGRKSLPVSGPPSSEDQSADVDVTDAEASGEFSPPSSANSPPSCLRPKKFKAVSATPTKAKTPSLKPKIKRRVLPLYLTEEPSSAGATDTEAPQDFPKGHVTALENATEKALKTVRALNPRRPLGKKASSPPSSPEEITPPTPFKSSGSSMHLDDEETAHHRLEQQFHLRETSILGDCLFDAIRQALVMRQRCCDWTFLRPIPRSAFELRSLLCDFSGQGTQASQTPRRGCTTQS